MKTVINARRHAYYQTNVFSSPGSSTGRLDPFQTIVPFLQIRVIWDMLLLYRLLLRQRSWLQRNISHHYSATPHTKRSPTSLLVITCLCIHLAVGI